MVFSLLPASMLFIIDVIAERCSVNCNYHKVFFCLPNYDQRTLC